MTNREAKEILLLFRPGCGDEADGQVAAALELARTDPNLQEWFQEHCAFQTALRHKFGEIPVPPTLKADILLGPKVVRGPSQWFTRRTVLAIAASVALFAIVGSIWRGSQQQLNFQNYRARMTGTLLREYRMEIVTNNMQEIRDYFLKKGAPADYVVPGTLASTSLTGAGVLTWQGAPVSMVCFDRGNKDMVFMLVSRKQHLPAAPGSTPELETVKELATASWSAGDKVYLLVASGEVDKLRTYLP